MESKELELESPGKRSIISQTFQSSIQALTYDDPTALLPIGGEERRDDRPGHLVLPLQLHLDVDGLAAGEVILVYIQIPAHKSILSINQS